MQTSEIVLEDTTPDDIVPASRKEHLVPYTFAKRHGALVTSTENNTAHILCLPDVSIEILSEIRRSLHLPLSVTYTDSDKFNEILREAYEKGTGYAEQVMDDLGNDLDLGEVVQQLSEPEDLLDSQDDAPIIRLINALLAEAIRENASDIHIEPYENRLVVRFRIDGVLREILQPNASLAPLLVSRIKVMAKLDISEKRLPQDGRISLKIAGRPVDIRVSTLPTGTGERVVMRLLDKQAGRLDLTQLGMGQQNLEIMERIIHRPHGIVLVTGPTGSGKTTTLYAALSRLNQKHHNIMTVEDPIEYDLTGISQTAVNTRIDMSFARGLRAILRQDPDVVMVGEIRDLETAQIAVQASLTGHLVFSTLHTNTAVGAITRLRDMGVEPFLLSSSLIGALAQRLVRLLCTHCKQPYMANDTELALLGLPGNSEQTLYSAVGCDHCNMTGYSGRTGIYDLMEVDETIKGMIHDGASEHEIEKYVRGKTESLRSDGLRRVIEGATSLDEVLRVTQAD